MPQASSNSSAQPISGSGISGSRISDVLNPELPEMSKSTHQQSENPEVPLQAGVQLKTVMSELNRLSESFVNSYQTLESQVEMLNGQLKNEAEEKQTALLEKQQLLIEKASLSDRLQNLLSIMPAGFVVIDGSGKVKDCNAVAVDILGRPLLGQRWLNVINRAFDPQADDGHQVSLKDGRKIHIETRALDSEPGQLVVLTDLTKTRQLQAELSQQQKLSSMGKMIASLAHQIRTPLSAAILYGSHLKNENLANPVKQQFSENLMERLHYIERQVNDMLNFMKGERKQKSLLTVAELFVQLRQLGLELPLPIDFEIDDQKLGKATLVADKDSLLGAITNLLSNACDACSSNETPEIFVNFKVADRLVITISDNGIGITKEKQKKIFEPFYTDKQKGNGLGLAIVHGVIIDHQGSIKVESEESEGTEFKISLPLISGTAGSVTPINTQQENQYEF